MASTLWFNPKCSKCREALSLLEARGIHPTLRRYLEEPPTRAELEMLHDALGFAMLRAKEEAARGLGEGSSREEVLAAIARDPVLLERPIFVHQGRAILGRPAARVLELL